MSPLLVILQTYQRTEYALATVKAIQDKLKYPGEIKWYVADDGSDQSHVEALKAAIGKDLVHVESHHWSYGGSANRAIHFAREFTDLTLWLEDDWELRRELAILPYAELLWTVTDIGMIRLGRLPKDLDCKSEGYNGSIFLSIQRTMPYMFSGNPSLRHRRFHDKYGSYAEGLYPGDTEIAFDNRMREHDCPIKIVWDVDLGAYGPFGHIGKARSY